MAKILQNNIFKLILNEQRFIYTSTQINVEFDEWRRKKGLPINPNRTPALLDGPDYTFLNGNPTPYGTNQKLRIEKQKAYTARIIQLTKEVDFAVERHQKLLEDEEKRKQDIINSKLKEKGKKYLN